MNIFETAARKKYRYPSAKGELTTEQLWDLPLVVNSPTRDVKVDLDTIARGVNAELRSVAEESFIPTKPDPRQGDLEVKLEILKHIIGVKMKEADDRKAAAERAAKRTKLLEALASKEDQALASMSKDDIMKQLAEIDGTN